MKSTILFGMMRGGSSIFATFLHQLFNDSGKRYFDPSFYAYERGILAENMSDQFLFDYLNTGDVIAPLRIVPKVFIGNHLLKDYNLVFILRDPRDCLVSAFFAQKNIHSVFVENSKPIPNEGFRILKGIDSYVIEDISQNFLEVANSYLDLINQFPNAIVYRYEDIITNIDAWLVDLCNRLEMKPPSHTIDRIIVMSSFHRLLTHEEEHRRSGFPGQYKYFLSDESISFLDLHFKKFLDYFGYNPQKSDFNANNNYIVLNNYIDKTNVPNIQSLYMQICSMKNIIMKLQEENGLRIEENKIFNQKISKINKDEI